MSYQRFWDLIDLYHKEELTTAQHAELDELYHSLNINPSQFQKVLAENGGEKSLIEKLQKDFKANYIPEKKNHFLKSNFYFIAAAACILIVASFALIFYHQNPIQKQDLKVEHKKSQILPGKDVAQLITSNGKIIKLEALNDKVLKGKDFTIKSGAIYFNNSKLNTITNTISTPKGGKYELILADGTHVWLNSQSKITFPSSFNGETRTVKLAGEAYFEVAKNPDQPFIVESGNQSLRVLGTHFNVNAYQDDQTLKTTLFEGKIKVKSTKENVEVNVLPGQQSILTNNSLTVKEADLKEALAWKMGYFKFNSEKIENIMAQISRWYNVDIKYKKSNNQPTITANISRSKNLDEVLEILELTQTVKFTIEGRTIYVTK